MLMRVPVTGMTIDVTDEATARLYQSRGFAVPVDPADEKPKAPRKRAPRKRAPRKTDKDKQ